MLQVNWDVWIPNPSGLPFRETVVVTVTEQKNDSHETARLTISCDRRPVCWNPLLMRPEWDCNGDGAKTQTVPMRTKIPWQLYRLIKGGE